MLDFLKQYAAEIVQLFMLAVISIIQIVKYGKVSKQTKLLSEDIMKYRTESYKDGQATPAQSFDKVVPEYQLDEKTNSLVMVGTKDLQEIVQSSADCALKKVLDKFGGIVPDGYMQPSVNVVGESDDVNVVDLKEDLDYYQEVLDFQEDLRQRYKFKDGMSLDEMIKILGDRKSKLDSDIQEKLKKQEVKEDEKKA